MPSAGAVTFQVQLGCPVVELCPAWWRLAEDVGIQGHSFQGDAKPVFLGLLPSPVLSDRSKNCPGDAASFDGGTE